MLASAIAKPHAEPVRNCSPFQNQQNAFARSALHLVSQDSASPRASFATHTPAHHSPPCSRAVAVTASPSLSLSPSPSYYTPSQHPVYSPISRCTRTPPASQSLAKFRSALTLPPKGYRYWYLFTYPCHPHASQSLRISARVDNCRRLNIHVVGGYHYGPTPCCPAPPLPSPVLPSRA